jgi:predicted CXXCH cytochrome family protein
MMKSMMKLAVAAALVFAAQTAQAGISGSPHDFSGRAWGTTETCIFCHTPHNAKATQLAPLWNHNSSTATYTLYTSATLNAVQTQPAGTTKACLSCHDGTVAIDTYGARVTGTTSVTGLANVGTDLSNDHPVSFPYTAALVTANGGGLASPLTASQVVAGIPLFNTNLECASCHAVHDNTVPNFLRASNAGSALCLKCHIK